MDLVNVVHHVRHTVEGTHANHVRQLLVSNAVDALCLPQNQGNNLAFWQWLWVGRARVAVITLLEWWRRTGFEHFPTRSKTDNKINGWVFSICHIFEAHICIEVTKESLELSPFLENMLD